MFPSIFFFNATATTEIYTLSLHDALPIWMPYWTRANLRPLLSGSDQNPQVTRESELRAPQPQPAAQPPRQQRSEEHTSELQSHSDLVCRLLLEKKKTNNPTTNFVTQKKKQ